MTRSATDDSKINHLHITTTDRHIAGLCVAAVTLSFIDLSIPLPLPGIKPGLANIVVLIALNRLGFLAAAWVSLLRVLTVGLLIGTLLSPTFMLSLSGAIISLVTLFISSQLPNRYFSAITQSVFAAFGHLGGQLTFVNFFLIPLPQLAPILPVLAGFCLLTGIINGIIVNTLLTQYHLS